MSVAQVTTSISYSILGSALAGTFHAGAAVFMDGKQLSYALVQYRLAPSAASDFIADNLARYLLPSLIEATGSDEVAIQMYLKPLLSGLAYWAIQKYLWAKIAPSMQEIFVQIASSVAAGYVQTPLAVKWGMLGDGKSPSDSVY